MLERMRGVIVGLIGILMVVMVVRSAGLGVPLLVGLLSGSAVAGGLLLWGRNNAKESVAPSNNERWIALLQMMSPFLLVFGGRFIVRALPPGWIGFMNGFSVGYLVILFGGILIGKLIDSLRQRNGGS